MHLIHVSIIARLSNAASVTRPRYLSIMIVVSGLYVALLSGNQQGLESRIQKWLLIFVIELELK